MKPNQLELRVDPADGRINANPNRPSVEVVRHLLTYDPETGVLMWRQRPVEMFADCIVGKVANAARWNRKFANKEALAPKNSGGYRSGKVLGVSLKAHCVVFAMMTGKWPALEIDHINGDTSDNRWINLREVPKLINMRNKRGQKNNTSGVTGVTWSKSKSKWEASIRVCGKLLYLGAYVDLNDAALARKRAEKKYGFSVRHGSLRTRLDREYADGLGNGVEVLAA